MAFAEDKILIKVLRQEHGHGAKRVLKVEEWQLLDNVIIDRAIKQWRTRLQSCVRERGGHFEHQL